MSGKIGGRVALAVAIIALAGCSTAQQTSQVPAASETIPDAGARKTQFMRAFAADCTATTAVAGIGLCTSIELAGSTVYGPSTPAAQVPGLHPADLQAAYRLPASTAGHNQTIGIVITNDDPNAAADLAVYRSTFGLPPCTAANGCFALLSAKNNPKGDKDWAREASTDLDMASATCPNCRLILYEAKSTKDSDLAAAVSAVIAAGATIVSNSYAIPESSGESSQAWSHPGVPILAAAGDSGYGAANWPAAATNVIAVGATTLTPDARTSRGWDESVWTGTGSGCSAVAAKPAWQTDRSCSMRTVADVSAVGDPSTPVAVYDSYEDNGWLEVGGTSVSTPIVAGVYGLAGNGGTLTGAASIYANRAALFAISSGSNGACTAAYFCTAQAGYSGPAGIGSPNGIAAF